MKQTTELHIAVFKDLIKRLINEKPELIIFDRLYLTQAFRAGVSISEYSELENILSKYDTITVFLKVDENHIADRVTEAAEHRDPLGVNISTLRAETVAKLLITIYHNNGNKLIY